MSLICAVSPAMAAPASADTIELDVLGEDGRPYTGAVSIDIVQRQSVHTVRGWGPIHARAVGGAVRVTANLEGIAPSVIASVRVYGSGDAVPESAGRGGGFYLDPCESLRAELRTAPIAADDGGAELRCRGLVLKAAPRYGTITVAGADLHHVDVALSAETLIGSPTAPYVELSIPVGPPVPIYGWQDGSDGCARFILPASSTDLILAFDRDQSLLVDLACRSNLVISTDAALIPDDDVMAVLVIPEHLYEPPSGDSLGHMLRIEDYWDHICYRKLGVEGKRFIDHLVPGPYRIELWRKSDLLGDRNATPARERQVVVQCATNATIDLN